MYVHLYRWGELKRELRSAGFRIERVIPLDEVSAAAHSDALAGPENTSGWMDRLRAAQARLTSTRKASLCRLIDDDQVDRSRTSHPVEQVLGDALDAFIGALGLGVDRRADVARRL